MNQPYRILSEEQEVNIKKSDYVVTVNGLCKSFGSAEILKNVNLKIKKRDVVSIIGPSGSGKSTLLRTLNLLEKPTSCEMDIAGFEIKFPRENVHDRKFQKAVTHLRTKVGMVFQSFNLWPHKTALQNVSEALIVVKRMGRIEAERIAREQLHLVGLSGKEDFYPNKLSGGQQQRVGIARALAMEPEIMLFDEPTSSLDPELVGEVLKVISKLADSGMTMIIVTHEMAFAQNVSSEICFMEDGQILTKGSPDEIFIHSKEPRIRSFLHNVKPHK
jgi:ABC-type polar amino acid transport system ATPase subunit